MVRQAAGYIGRSSSCYRSALERWEKAMQFAYRDRRNRRRDLRRLWIIRINAAAREYGLKYSELMCGLARANISLDRKVLSELAVNDKDVFAGIMSQAKAALA
jgi:large subunit ribosomal protein L20